MTSPRGETAAEQRPSGRGGETSLAVRRFAPDTWLWPLLRRARRLRPPPDPARAGLRRAARAALVMPAAFVVAQFAIGNAQVTTFVAFGCFALLVFADFGGLRSPRALAYVAATGIGAVLIALGTLASGSPWGAALLMLLVGFGVAFVGVFGSYAAAAQTALLLAFVLAVSIPAPPAAIAPRLGGWLIAGAVSSLAGVFLWPRFERVALRRQAASACRAIGLLIQVQRSRTETVEAASRRQHAAAAAEGAVAVVRQAYAATPKRPAGPARRDRAFVELLSELERIVDFTAHPPSRQPRLSAQHPCLQEGDRLASTVVQTLDSSAETLTGSGLPPDVEQLQAVWRAHREALDRWAVESLRAGSAAEEVLDGLQADDALRIVAFLTLALGTNAAIAVGARGDSGARVLVATSEVRGEIPVRTGLAGFVLRVGKTIRTQLAPSSSVLHNSLRVALGLALAVLIARLLQLDHAFWVVLGTLSALRSNALATGRTTLQALAGTLVGFIIGAAFLVLVGTGSAILWIVLPISVFLAAYAASAVGFVAGQAAFTVVVLILFNLIAPVGWRLGVARVEDVAVGVGISVVVGVLLWPRGARGELRATLAGLYRAVTDLLAAAFGRLLEPQPKSSGAAEAARGIEAQGRAQDRAVAARDRAGEALDQYLHERGAKPVAPEDVGPLVAAGSDAILAAELLHQLADTGYQTPVDGNGGAEAMAGHVRELIAAYTRLADELDGAGGATSGEQADIVPATVRVAELSSLRQWSQDPEVGHAAIAVVVAGEWVEHLGALAAALEERVVKAAAAARVPWWR